jgi:hypothetical protein
LTGFLDEHALAHEVRGAGFGIVRQHSLIGPYDGAVAGQCGVNPLVEPASGRGEIR